MSTFRARRKFPQLNINDLKYCCVFYEGQHDDARTNLAIAQTASLHGALMLNYCNLIELMKGTEGRVTGAIIVDKLSGERIQIKTKSIVFCGGPFTDELRKLEDPECKNVVQGAGGVHIVIPGHYAPNNFGLVDMSTSDGRFLFFLPWEGHVLIGTTDHASEPTMRPRPSEEEIQWLLAEASKYLSKELQMRRQDVLSAWSGIRPLAVDPNVKSGTASVSRDHIVSHNPQTGVVFIAGGKWTTYREMAEDGVNKILETCPELNAFKSVQCKTLTIPLIGKEGSFRFKSEEHSKSEILIGYSANLSIRLIQEFGISKVVADHLTRSYGGRAFDVLDVTRKSGISTDSLLVPGFPYLEGEVIFSLRHDWAATAEDILARRTRLAFLNKVKAIEAIPKIVNIMAKEFGWNNERSNQEIQRTSAFMDHFGGPKT